MSEAKHTSGPWVKVRSRIGRKRGIEGANGQPICTLEGNSTPAGMVRERSGETEANWNLINAAPDLLEALTDNIDGIATVADRLSHGSPERNTLEAVVAEFRAAIAKATST